MHPQFTHSPALGARLARQPALGGLAIRLTFLTLALLVLFLFGQGLAWPALALTAAGYAMLCVALYLVERRRASLAPRWQSALDMLSVTLLIHFLGALQIVAAALYLIPILEAGYAEGSYVAAAYATAALLLALVFGAERSAILGIAVPLYAAGISVGYLRSANVASGRRENALERAVREAAKELSTLEDLDQMLAFVGERIHALAGADACIVRTSPDAASEVWFDGTSHDEVEEARAPLASLMRAAGGAAVPLRMQDLTPQLAASWRAAGVQCALLLPLAVADDPSTCGWVELRFHSAVDLAQREDLLAPLVHHAAVTLARQQQREETQKMRQRIADLHEGTARLAQGADRTAMLAAGVALGRRLAGARYAAIALWDGQGRLREFSTSGLTPEQQDHLGQGPAGDGLLHIVRSAPGPVRRASTQTAVGEGIPLPPGHPPITSFLGVPLRLGDWTGAFYLLRKEGAAEFSDTDEQICDLLGTHLAFALGAIRQAGEERERYSALLELLGAVTDAREQEVAGHSRRVAEYAKSIAAALGLPSREAERIGHGALLHDIGKIGIPDSILRKPGRLSDEERLVMVSHAPLGGQIVSGASTLSPLAPLVRHHHEWFNGRGYPDALVGEAIPLGARILSVADALDSITTDRPYRKARSLQEAFDELQRCAGSQFDPDIVAAAITVLGGGLSAAPSDPPELHSLVQQEWDLRTAAWRVLRHLGERLRSVLDIEALGADILDLLSRELGYVRGSLSVLEPSGEELRVVAVEDLPQAIWPGMIIPRGRGISWDALASGRPMFVPDLEADPRHVGHSGMHHAAVFVPLLGAGGAPQGMLVVHRPLPAIFNPSDIEQLEALAVPIAEAVAVARLHDELRRLMSRDSLTGTLDRQTGLGELEAALAVKAPLSILLCDVDDLSAYNRARGTGEGDLALQRLANALRSALEPEDRLSRLSGDSFLVLLPLRGTDAAETIARAIEDADVPPHSFGSAEAPKDGDTVQELLAVAQARITAVRVEKI
ncbi:MAG: GAF domain-containing protein [Thermaerobacter sp.]|nr:GAF domain-containing protein [Thermaerobacter sp.]